MTYNAFLPHSLSLSWLMIEPTETENKDTLDAFADALIKIAEEARTQPDLLHNAPSATQFGRMDEVKAARELVLPKVLVA